MHRDKKIGFALSILLIAVVAAFFYRKGPDDEEPVPQLENPQEIDDRIAEKSMTPYLTGVEPAGDVEATTVAAETKPPTAPSADVWEVPDFLKETGDAGAPPLTFSEVTSPPDPIIVQKEGNGVPPAVPVPAHNNAWEPITDDKPTTTKSQSTNNTTAALTHEVQAGDTLSGLSQKYLGTTARFLEIYNLNRDVLKSPDDLRVGLQLKIPQQSATASQPAQTTGRTVSSKTREPSATGAAPQPAATPDRREAAPKTNGRLFQPATRNPLNPNRGTPQAGTNGPPTKAVRSLTQVPPDNLPISIDDSFDDQPVDLVQAPSASAKITGVSTIAKTQTNTKTPANADTNKTPATNSSSTAQTQSNPSATRFRHYRVQRGDSLERIAIKVYGRPTMAGQIFAANRAQLKDPDAIRVGMLLLLP